MSTTVTLNIYSGMPNPTWELTTDQEIEFNNKFSQMKFAPLDKSPVGVGLLGYRGFEVQSIENNDISLKASIFGSIINIGDVDDQNMIDSEREIELFLLEIAKDKLDKDLFDYVKDSIKENLSDAAEKRASGFQVMDAPPFDPGYWNNDPCIKKTDNCYNYAVNKATYTFAQPGRGSGQKGPDVPVCTCTGAAAERDGVVKATSTTIVPSDGHLVALVIWPGKDFHWYRKDKSNNWSHKPGSTDAINTDNDRKLISNPETCARGNYTVFCGYYICIPDKTTIS